MSLLLKDLLHDLREKRLWPLAAVLLLGIVAVPAIMLRSPSEDALPAPAASLGSGAQTQAAEVALATEDDVPASSLDSFEEKDPFEPRGSAAPTPPAQAAVPSAQESPTSPPFGGLSNPPSVDLPGLGFGGDGGGFGDTDPSVPAPDEGGESERKPVAYAYTVDVRFGRRDGTTRTYHGLERLDVLPRGDDAPVLVFLGVSPTAKTAIFLVDSSVDQHGDGRCKPSREECSFLHLTTERGHDLHYLQTEEGVPYAVRLLEIRKERVDQKEAKASRKAMSSRERRETPQLGADEVVEKE